MITYSLLNHKLWPHVSSMSFSDTELGHALRFIGLPALGRAHECGPWVAGGSVRRGVLGESLGKDIDVFFSNEESYQSFLVQLMALDNTPFVRNDTGRVMEVGVEPAYHKPIVLDLVYGVYFTDVEALLEDFDFTCCQFAVDQDKLYVGDLAMLHAGQRLLRANNWAKLKISYPHMVRYMHDGWCPGKNELDALLADLQETPDILYKGSGYSGPADKNANSF